MSTVSQTGLAGQVEVAAKAAGLVVVASEEGKDCSGGPTARFTLGLASNPAKTQTLELSTAVRFLSGAALKNVVESYLAEVGHAAEESSRQTVI